MQKRIWELDAFRGLCVLGMVIVHFLFDLTQLYGIVRWNFSALFYFVLNWGGILFLLLSGICATLGRRSIRRGIIVFGCGMLCTAVTLGMYLLSFADHYIIIRFGVLHCLGICMILWAVFKKLPTRTLALLGFGIIILGFLFQKIRVEAAWLFPLGLRHHGFSSADYFPLLPHLGFFFLGAVIGRTVYRNNKTLLPRVSNNTPVLRFLRFCGRQSLPIYLLHQPILSLVCLLLTL